MPLAITSFHLIRTVAKSSSGRGSGVSDVTRRKQASAAVHSAKPPRAAGVVVDHGNDIARGNRELVVHLYIASHKAPHGCFALLERVWGCVAWHTEKEERGETEAERERDTHAHTHTHTHWHSHTPIKGPHRSLKRVSRHYSPTHGVRLSVCFYNCRRSTRATGWLLLLLLLLLLCLFFVLLTATGRFS